MSCDAAPVVVAEAMDSVGDGDCAVPDLDFGGRVATDLEGVDLTLQRARAEIAMRAYDVQARLALIGVQTGGEGAVGVGGQAFVPALQIAEARYDLRAAGLAVAGGLVDDPWLMVVQGTWGNIAIERPMAAARGWVERSDVGLWAGFTAPQRKLSATVGVATGEGARAREVNAEPDVTGVVWVRPQAGTDADVQIEAAAGARYGTRGPDSAQDHRAAGAVFLRHEAVVVGVDGMLGWGLAGDADARPAGISAWGRTGVASPVQGLARVDVATDVLGTDPAELLGLVAAGPRLPWGERAAPGSLLLGYEVRAGEEVGHLLFLQLGARVRGPIDL
ncbi:MAG: hypothetical protein KC621_09790 [Myxococcales bacterium]|nr:hypothetical protein [Myxococcales bacterium]